jgi:hypothetical protein
MSSRVHLLQKEIAVGERQPPRSQPEAHMAVQPLILQPPAEINEPTLSAAGGRRSNPRFRISGQIVKYEEVANTGNTSAENPMAQRRPGLKRTVAKPAGWPAGSAHRLIPLVNECGHFCVCLKYLKSGGG